MAVIALWQSLLHPSTKHTWCSVRFQIPASVQRAKTYRVTGVDREDRGKIARKLTM
jgi:hypothetical protein